MKHHEPDPANDKFCRSCGEAIEGSESGQCMSAAELVECVFTLPKIREAAAESVQRWSEEEK